MSKNSVLFYLQALSILLMRSSYAQYENNAISFTVDSAYLHWTTKFPSILFCEKGNEKYSYFAEQWFGTARDFDIDDLLVDISFFSGKFGSAAIKCQKGAEDRQGKCPESNYEGYAEAIRSSCDELFTSCSWNDEEFDCCKHILNVETVYGVCFGVNSLPTIINSSLSFKISRKTNGGVGKLSVELANPTLTAYILSQEEVPLYNTGAIKIYDGYSRNENHGKEYNIYLAVKEMKNEKEVKTVDIKRRGCRFQQENNLEVYKVYSYPACLTECLKNLHIQTCNCTHHLMPGASLFFVVLDGRNICFMDGLLCLTAAYDDLLEKMSNCQCESSCEETEVKLLGSITNYHPEKFQHKRTLTRLNFETRTPTVTFVRKVVNGNLDMIVSLGSVAALCVGASALSVVEIFYYFIIRPLGASTICNFQRKRKKARRKQKNNNKNRNKRYDYVTPFPFVN